MTLAELEAAAERIGQERERLTTAYLRSILHIEEYEKQMETLATDLETTRQGARTARRILQQIPDSVARREELQALIPDALHILTQHDISDEARRVIQATFKSIRCEGCEVIAVLLW